MATPDQPDLPEASAAGSGATPVEADLFVDADDRLAAATNELAAVRAELKEQQLRGLAELDNLRKRNAQEVRNARDFAVREFAFSLLAVKDALEMVLKDEHGTAEQIKMGVDMTLKNLVAAFERARVVEVPAERAKFDPNVHEAMAQIASATEAPGTVLQVFQKGYTIADRVLRPAMVAVAKAPDAGAAPPTP